MNGTTFSRQLTVSASPAGTVPMRFTVSFADTLGPDPLVLNEGQARSLVAALTAHFAEHQKTLDYFFPDRAVD